MIDKTKQILSQIDKIIENLNSYKEYVKNNNACTYSDRILETGISNMDKLKKIYESQFETDFYTLYDQSPKNDSLKIAIIVNQKLSDNGTITELWKKNGQDLKNIFFKPFFNNICQLTEKMLSNIPYIDNLEIIEVCVDTILNDYIRDTLTELEMRNCDKETVARLSEKALSKIHLLYKKVD